MSIKKQATCLMITKMKKILSILLLLLLVGILVACAEAPEPGEATPTPIEVSRPKHMEQAAEPIAEGIAEVGVIIGDVLYKGIEISRLFIEPFVDVLGSPLGERGAFFFYENFEIVSGWDYGLEPNQGVVIQFSAWEPNLNLFELNGFTLDMTRLEVIATFGAPMEYWDFSLTYHISNPVADYMLIFRFEDWEDNNVLTSISIFRMYWQVM